MNILLKLNLRLVVNKAVKFQEVNGITNLESIVGTVILDDENVIINWKYVASGAYQIS